MRVLLGAVTSGLIACRKTAVDDTTLESVVTVQAAHPTRGPISEEIATDAILAPLSQAAIAPRISAPILTEYVQRGSHVHRGQLLVTLESRDLEGSAEDTQGGVVTARAAYAAATQATIPEDVQKAQLDVEQTKANLEVASRTADERKRLVAQGAIAGRDADTATALLVQAQASHAAAVKHLASVQTTTERTSREAAEGALTSAQGKLASAQAMASYASLRSPIDGVVTDRPLFPGETAAAGTTVITVMDTSSLLAKLHLAQASAQKLGVGGTAEIYIPGVEDPQTARVMLISPALDPGSTTVEVWLKLSNDHSNYKVGTPVRAVIRGATIASALQVPSGAILLADDGSTSLLTIGSDGKAHKKIVTVGLRTSSNVQILSGISASDLVITDGGYGLDEGTRVKVKSEFEEKDTKDAPNAGDKDK